MWVLWLSGFPHEGSGEVYAGCVAAGKATWGDVVVIDGFVGVEESTWSHDDPVY
jgi:hypothetical protein